MKSKHIAAILLLTSILLSVFSSTTSFAFGQTETINVIVGFKYAPDLELITQNGGVIHEVYSIIPAIYASLPQAAIEQLKENPNVAYVEENNELKASGYTVRWGLDHINASQSWSQSTGEGVKVAVLDTGVGPVNDVTVYGGYNFVNNNANYSDDAGHGTMVAGIIAASTDSTIGVAGVAPDAQIYAVKVIDSAGVGSVANAISGVQWAVNNGMKIISMSWTINDENYALREALQAAYNSGVLLVAAAGNSGDVLTGVGCPACYESVIAVSAIKGDNVRLEEACVGSEIELTAPGESIYSTWIGNVLGVGSGTSLAAAFVSGTAALVWAKNPSLTNVQVRTILDTTAFDLQPSDGLDRDIFYGYGLVNASAAVSATPKNSDADFSWSPNAIYAGKQVIFDASSSFGGVNGFTSYAWNFDDGTITTVDSAVVAHTFTVRGSYSVNLTVNNDFGFKGSKVQAVSVLQDTMAPVTSDNYDGTLHTSIFTITLTASDDSSGVAQTYYRLNDGSTKTLSADGQPLINVNGLNIKLEYWSVDLAGNEETHRVLTNIKLETTPQTAEPSPNATQTQPTSTIPSGNEQFLVFVVLGIVSIMVIMAVCIVFWHRRRKIK